MKIRTGIDLVEIDRIRDAIRRYGDRFLRRVYTPTELDDARESVASLAARFAAKEATAKALGTGIGPISWLEVEIIRQGSGQPQLQLHGEARRSSEKQNLTDWSVSLSHTKSLAISIVAAVEQPPV